MHTVSINTANPYKILVGDGLLMQTASLLSDIGGYSRAVIVTDDRVAPLYLAQVKDSFPKEITVGQYIIKNGEQSKNSANLLSLVDYFADQKLTRSDLVIALGGGVVGDLTGFAASVYLRGIRYIQIPTTLLSQVDSSVGGKTAVNISAGKNLMGTFYQPERVICDTDTLHTLDRTTFCDGLGEVIKYGCIWDSELFEKLYHIDEVEILTDVIIRCIEIKAEVVGQDEFDKGLRMILNFGHTIGHAIEKHYRFSGITHGQGVAIGMVHITALSEHAGLTRPGTAEQVLRLVQHLDLPFLCMLKPEELFTLCGMDKKNIDGAIHLILLKEIGSCFIHKMTKPEFKTFLCQPVSPPSVDRRLSGGKLSGQLTVPPSKSIFHRALICAALAPGESVIHSVYLSEDILATMNCMEALGASFDVGTDCIRVSGIQRVPENAVLHCNESGSTLRFLIPLAAALGVSSSFTGSGRLVNRPLDIYTKLLPQHGAAVEYSGSLPLSLSGTLTPGHYILKGNVSSQFVTGLLFALPLLDGDSTIEVLPPFESKSYVNITLDTLKSFGIRIKSLENSYQIPGNQQFCPCEYTVESDFSQAAFFLAANAMGSEITLERFSEDSIQGDHAVLDILRGAGLEPIVNDGAISMVYKKANPFTIDASDIPDLVPILCILAATLDGVSVIRNVERLRIKESDRIATTMELLETLGGTISYSDGAITVTGGQPLHGGEVTSHNDHRIAMCAAIASLVCNGEIILRDAGSVSKSYPTFFNDFQILGGKADVIHVE